MEQELLIPDEEKVTHAILGAVFNNLLQYVPDEESLAEMREQGLEAHLPSWYDFENKEPKRKEFLEEVMKISTSHYLPAEEFIEYYKREQGEVIAFDFDQPDFNQFFEGFRAYVAEEYPNEVEKEWFNAWCTDLALDYITVKEILRMSPQGLVNEEVYEICEGRVTRAVGLDVLKKLYQENIKFVEEGSPREYRRILHKQAIRMHSEIIEDPRLDIELDEGHPLLGDLYQVSNLVEQATKHSILQSQFTMWNFGRDAGW